jgi:hypothetical protein
MCKVKVEQPLTVETPNLLNTLRKQSSSREGNNYTAGQEDNKLLLDPIQRHINSVIIVKAY